MPGPEGHHDRPPSGVQRITTLLHWTSTTDYYRGYGTDSHTVDVHRQWPIMWVPRPLPIEYSKINTYARHQILRFQFYTAKR